MSKNQMALYLKEKRAAAELSQGQVAKELGYTSAQFISNWERGLSLPPVDSLKRLASLYKVPEQEMLEKIIEITVAQVRAELEHRFRKLV